ncbi:MAG: hypothetical protein HYW49_13980 [Deltaproteobacteria bacterium]|nr:hypothetical protein [Deltaproteobacteria bacterium]
MLQDQIAQRLKERNMLIQVVIGPRQIGKTTSLKAALAGRGIYHTADYPAPLPHTEIEKWWKEALDHAFALT